MNLNATLLGQMIAFGLFVWFCWKFVWPPLLAAMEERAQKIEQGLKDSEESAKKILEAEEESKKMLTKAKNEAKKIMDNAKSQSEKMVEEAKTKASDEKERIVGSAEPTILSFSSLALVFASSTIFSDWLFALSIIFFASFLALVSIFLLSSSASRIFFALSSESFKPCSIFCALSSIAAKRGGHTNFQQNQTNSPKAIICPSKVAFKFISYATNNT